MRIFSEKYKELSEKSGRYPLLKIELYEGTRFNWTNTVIRTISGSNYIKSASYTSGTTIKPNKFETGTAYCAKFSAVLTPEIFADLKYSQRIKVYIGFKDFENSTEEFIALGVFYIEEKELRSEGVYISGRDIMMYAEASWFPYNLTYPCTLTEVYRDVVRRMGGTVDESYTLPVEATVLEAPYTASDPNVIYIHGETELDGKPYTCRQIIAQIARMQLGNAYVDGDGYVKFYSYDTVGNINDSTITEIRIDDEFYSNLGVFYAYGDRTQEQVKGEETYGTIVFFTTLPIEDLNEEHYNQLKDQAKKACGWGWKGGQIVRKGQGNAEPGDKIEYSGKYGNTRFFVSGVIMEWANGSYDETIYSFAPTYEDSAYSSNNTDSAPSEVEGEAANSSGGLTIENAVVIQEADAKYLLHEYTEVDFIQGNRIAYAGAQNQIVTQFYITYARGGKAPNGTTIDNLNSETLTGVPDIPIYGEIRFSELAYNKWFGVKISRLWIKLTASYVAYDAYDLIMTTIDGAEQNLTGFTDYKRDGNIGLALLWSEIHPPGYASGSDTYPYGCAACTFAYKYGTSSGYKFDVYSGADFLIGFASEAEYNAAVGLTYEPNTLTEVQDTITEV